MSHHLALFRFWVTEVTSPYGLIPRNLDMGKSQTGKSNERTGHLSSCRFRGEMATPRLLICLPWAKLGKGRYPTLEK